VETARTGKASDFRQLVVWQRSMELASEVYRLTGLFPREEIYGLTAQLRRAVISIPSNIAEGHARRTTRELVQFAAIAQGSLAEVQTQLILAGSLGYCLPGDQAKAEELVAECQRMLIAMQKTLRDRIRNGTERR
jgi:four helix bundle protein